MRRFSAAATLLIALLAGMLPLAASAAAVPDPDVPDSRVVVAPMDSGINPYHAAFRVQTSSVTQDVLDAFGVPPQNVLTLSDDFAKDAAIWAQVKVGQDYHFTGTNIIARSFSPSGSRVILPGNNDTHGVGVSGAVAAANPEAIIYFIQGGFLDDGEPWAFNHPEIDIVTMSYGLPAAAMTAGRVDAYEGVVEQGKLSFGAATNDPQVALLDGTAGPWYEIAIAGYTEQQGSTQETRETFSGNVVDFLADFTQTLPYCATCTTDTRSVSGTSFATPRSAGITSRILLQARRAAGHIGGITEDGLMVDAGGIELSNWDLRRALEEAAYYPTATGIGGNMPVNSTAPYVQAGWGALSTNHGVIDRALDQLLDPEAAPLKDAATCDYMTQYMNSRYVLWDANPDPLFGGSGSFGQTNVVSGSPYIPCSQGRL